MFNGRRHSSSRYYIPIYSIKLLISEVRRARNAFIVKNITKFSDRRNSISETIGNSWRHPTAVPKISKSNAYEVVKGHRMVAMELNVFGEWR